MIRPILTDPNKELRKKSKAVDSEDFLSDEIQNLVDDLIETMKVENGVGIAAPQIGVLKRVIIVEDEDGPRAFINPKIISKSFRKIKGEEGCLSVPGIYGMVKRSKSIKLKAFDRDGNPVTISAEGFPATVFQHEVDHLNGILFIDKIIDYTSPPKM